MTALIPPYANIENLERFLASNYARPTKSSALTLDFSDLKWVSPLGL